MMYLAIALVVANVIQTWLFLRTARRKDEETLVERRELTDRIMALSSRPESVAVVRQEAEEAEVNYSGEDTPWWQEDSE